VTAEHLVANGWNVYATARRIETIKDLGERGCHILTLDVCDDASMETAVQAVEEAEGAVGVLINNAGYGEYGAVETLDIARLRRQFETNVFGLVRLTQLVLPGMRSQRWGRIVNLSSMGGKLTLPGGGAYHSSKFAVESLSDALRFEVRGFGIDVVVIEPGPVLTAFDETVVGGIDVDDPTYGAFHAGVVKGVASAYQKPLSMFASKPIAVARTVERAITRRRPRTRYKVGMVSGMLTSMRKVVPDRAFDAFARTQFKPPS
jgi:short-subunit dehydrogenase